MIYFELFWTFIKIGVFNFGGGYAMISFIQKEIVEKHLWLSATEFTNIIAIAESTPGPLAINSATYAGYNVAGVSGAIVANLGLFAPALLIIIVLSGFLIKHQKSFKLQGVLAGLKPVTSGLILASALMLVENIVPEISSLILGIIAFALVMWTNLHPVVIILGLGILGIFIV